MCPTQRLADTQLNLGLDWLANLTSIPAKLNFGFQPVSPKLTPGFQTQSLLQT